MQLTEKYKDDMAEALLQRLNSKVHNLIGNSVLQCIYYKLQLPAKSKEEFDKE